MRREKVFSIVVSSLLTWMLVGLPFAFVAEAQDVVVGVYVGDWAKYGDIVVEFDSTDPNVEPNEEVMELQKTAWFETVVAEIYQTQVALLQTTTFKDGTQNTTVLQIELTTGIGNGTSMLISAGLSEGEWVYPSPIEASPLGINETITRVYGGTTRVVNHVNVTSTNILSDNPLQSVYASIDYYWDQETGILTERNGIVVNRTGFYVTSWKRSDKIEDTNLWRMKNGDSTNGNEGEGSAYGTVGVIAVAATITVAVIIRQRKKKFRTRKSHKRH